MSIGTKLKEGLEAKEAAEQAVIDEQTAVEEAAQADAEETANAKQEEDFNAVVAQKSLTIVDGVTIAGHHLMGGNILPIIGKCIDIAKGPALSISFLLMMEDIVAEGGEKETRLGKYDADTNAIAINISGHVINTLEMVKGNFKECSLYHLVWAQIILTILHELKHSAGELSIDKESGIENAEIWATEMLYKVAQDCGPMLFDPPTDSPIIHYGVEQALEDCSPKTQESKWYQRQLEHIKEGTAYKDETFSTKSLHEYLYLTSGFADDPLWYKPTWMQQPVAAPVTQPPAEVVIPTTVTAQPAAPVTQPAAYTPQAAAPQPNGQPLMTAPGGQLPNAPVYQTPGIPTYQPHKLHPMRVEAIKELVLYRLYKHVFENCGWYNQAWHTAGLTAPPSGFGTAEAVRLPVEVSDIKDVEKVFPMLDVLDNNNQMVHLVPLNTPGATEARTAGQITGLLSRDAALPRYSLFIDEGQGPIQFNFICQNRAKIRQGAGDFSAWAKKAQQGKQMMLLFRKGGQMEVAIESEFQYHNGQTQILYVTLNWLRCQLVEESLLQILSLPDDQMPQAKSQQFPVQPSQPYAHMTPTTPGQYPQTAYAQTPSAWGDEDF